MKHAPKQMELHVDLDKILDVALRGVRRASVFMGLGVNAALNPTVNNYQLTKITKLQLVPEAKDAEALAHVKNEFRTWVEGNGLRELIETFAIFLERLHDGCSVFRAAKDKVNIASLGKARDSFRRAGFPKKLNILRSSFAVSPKYPDYLLSLNRARNCLTHRRGIVANDDIDSSRTLRVSWLGMDIFVKTPSGERHSLMDIPSEGLLLRNEGTVCLQFVERERVFDVGSIVGLSTRDLAEICWFFANEARTTMQTTMEYAKVCGIDVQVIDKKAKPDKTMRPPMESDSADQSGS